MIFVVVVVVDENILHMKPIHDECTSIGMDFGNEMNTYIYK